MDTSFFHSRSTFEFLGRRAVLTGDVITPDGDVLRSGEEVLISGVGEGFTVITSSGVIVESVPASCLVVIGSPFEWDHLLSGRLEQEYCTSGTSSIEVSLLLGGHAVSTEVLHTSFKDGWGLACTHILTWRPAYSDSHFELSERPQAVLLKCSHPDIDGVFIVSGWATRDSASSVRYEFSAGVVAGCTILGWRPDYE